MLNKILKFTSKPVLLVLLLVTTALTFLLLSGSPLMAQTNEPLSDKLCSGIVPGVFRDTINVPFSWSPRACKSFANSIGAQTYQLGCITYGGFVWGNSGGGRPFAECGW